MTGEFAIAVHALVYLNHKEMILNSEALAENVCTNPARIRKIMAKLKKAGLVVTKEGLEGGYSFEKKADTVSLKDIAEAIDADFVCSSWKSGNKEMKCMVASGMADIMDGIYDELDQQCKQRLALITVADIDKKIFAVKKKEGR